MNQPLITIITVTYNAAQWLEHCVESVCIQKREGFEIEHLIIDGASTDGTVEMLQRYKIEGEISSFLSEKDSGVYDAMNKGLHLAQGEVIAFLNADDGYTQDNIVEKLGGPILREEVDYTFADACIVDERGETIGFHYANMNDAYIGSPYCHQTLFCRTSLLRKAGGFDTALSIVADADFEAKLVRDHRLYRYIPEVCVNFLKGGKSSQFYLDEIAFLYLKYAKENIEYSKTNDNVVVQLENLSCYLKEMIEKMMAGTQDEQGSVKVASARFSLYCQRVGINSVWPAYMSYFEKLEGCFSLLGQVEKRDVRYWEKFLSEVQTICPESRSFVRRLERLWNGDATLQKPEMRKLYYKTIRRIARNMPIYWGDDRIRLAGCLKPLSPVILKKYFFNSLETKNHLSIFQRLLINGISYYYQWIKND